MFFRDKLTGEKIILVDLHCLELNFDKVYKLEHKYILRNLKGVLVAEVMRSEIDEKTRSKLDGLSEFKP